MNNKESNIEKKITDIKKLLNNNNIEFLSNENWKNNEDFFEQIDKDLNEIYSWKNIMHWWLKYKKNIIIFNILTFIFFILTFIFFMYTILQDPKVWIVEVESEKEKIVEVEKKVLILKNNDDLNITMNDKMYIDTFSNLRNTFEQIENKDDYTLTINKVNNINVNLELNLANFYKIIEF